MFTYVEYVFKIMEFLLEDEYLADKSYHASSAYVHIYTNTPIKLVRSIGYEILHVRFIDYLYLNK